MLRIFGIKNKPQKNFVVAMAVSHTVICGNIEADQHIKVFGNSNSLPLSLVVSLSHTISGLHWDKKPGDNDDEVAARGILYLLIFSQLGQALRWSWGMNTLLKPMKQYTPEERGEDNESGSRYKDSPSQSRPDSIKSSSTEGENRYAEEQIVTDELAGTSSTRPHANGDARQRTLAKAPNGDVSISGDGVEESTPEPASQAAHATGYKGLRIRTQQKAVSMYHQSLASLRNTAVPPLQKAFRTLPPSVQKILTSCWLFSKKVILRMIACINVPLAAIIVSIIVATIAPIKAIFYTPGSFVNNTLTSAINQLGGVAIPLILFILGGNLCRSTQPKDDPDDLTYKKEKRSMLVCALLSRMLIPFIIMAPILTLTAKYLPISILDDPIFLIVCFLLTGAPSALQLAQMCQVNDVFVPVMSNLLVHSYVIWYAVCLHLSKYISRLTHGIGFSRRHSCSSSLRSRSLNGLLHQLMHYLQSSNHFKMFNYRICFNNDGVWSVPWYIRDKMALPTALRCFMFTLPTFLFRFKPHLLGRFPRFTTHFFVTFGISRYWKRYWWVVWLVGSVGMRGVFCWREQYSTFVVNFPVA